MRPFAGFGLLLVLLGILVWYGIGAMAGDQQGPFMPVAFAPAGTDTIEIQMAVSIVKVGADPPRQDDGQTVVRDDGSSYFQPPIVHWDEWLEEHFELVSADGERVPVTKKSVGRLFKGPRGPALADFVIAGPIEKGTECTLDYIPVVGEPTRYRHTFTAPEEEQRMQRVQFKPVTQ